VSADGKARVDVGCVGGGESGACDLSVVWCMTRGESRIPP
jgi:hypothetical protein